MTPEPYDDATCARYADGLGDAVLARARVLFALLDERGSVASDELALALGLPRAQLIPGAVNTRLKVRAAECRLPLPFDGGTSATATGTPRRTSWRDRAGTAARMVRAIDAELADRAGAQRAAQVAAQPTRSRPDGLASKARR